MTRIIPAFLAVALASVTVTAQTPAPAATPQPPAAVPASAAPPASGPHVATAAAVEAVESNVTRAGSAPAATGVAAPAQGYTYNAEGRRDPFLPLLKNGTKDPGLTTPAARVAGLAGLGASEVTLRGVLLSQGAYVGMLHGTDEKTYIVRTGDKLADGTIRSITSEMLVIQQHVKDPLSRQKEREVRKILRQTDGTN